MLLGRIQRHELQFWALIHDQHELRTQLKTLSQRLLDVGHPLAQQLASIDSTMCEYEAQTWQVVPSQVSLRLKLAALNSSAINWPPIKIEMETFDDDTEWVDETTSTEISEALTTAITDEAFYATENSSDAIEQFATDLYECRMCQQAFHQKQTLREHVDRYHADAEPMLASDASDPGSESFASERRHEIMIINDNRRFECYLCKRAYAHKPFLRRHMLSEHIEPSLTCATCHQTQKGRECLNDHMWTAHRIGDARPHFSCNECGTSWRSKASLEQHTLQHTCQPSFGCTKCDHRAKTALLLSKHMQSHCVNRPFRCSQCDEKFETAFGLNTHVRGAHAAEKGSASGRTAERIDVQSSQVKPYRCDECSEHFFTSFQRFLHTRKVHTGENPYECVLCHQRFLIKVRISKVARFGLAS